MAVGRFQTMAMLQAARAEALGLSHDSALSFGLNRSIFYAAAKRGFRGTKMKERPHKEVTQDESKKKKDTSYKVGDELAYTDPNSKELLFAFEARGRGFVSLRAHFALRANIGPVYL